MIKKGIVLSFITAIISGFSIFANTIFVSKADPLVFATIRNLLVACMFTIVLVGAKQAGRLKILSTKEWMLLIGVGAIGGGIPFALFFRGLSLIGAINGNILQKTLFLWVALLAVPLLKERIKPLQFLGYAVVFAGMFVFGGTLKVIPTMGTYLVLTATILWAIENIIAKVALRTISPLIVSWSRMVFGLPFLLAAVLFFGKTHALIAPGTYTMTPLVISSVFLAAYMSVWYLALSKAPATVVSSVLVVAPIVTAFAGSIVFHKAIIGSQYGVYGALLIGSLLIALSREKKQVSV